MNSSSNISDPKHVASIYFSAFVTTTMGIISIVAFIGNTLVITAVCKTPRLRTSTNYHYVNMAVSDLICSITTWPLYLTDEIITSTGSVIQGPLATIGCQIGVYSRMVSHSVSILSLVAISISRFIAIVLPLKANLLTSKLRVALVAAIWVLSLAYYVPDILFSRVEKVGQVTSCIFTWVGLGVLIYDLISIVIFHVAPVVTIIAIYFRVMRVLHSRMKPQYVRKASDFENKRNKQNKNIMKTFISIVLVLVICFLFFSLYFVLQVPLQNFLLKDKCKVTLAFCYFVFPFLSTMTNPLILFAFSSNFRHAMLRVWPFSVACRIKRFSVRVRSYELSQQAKTCTNYL